jgi:GAF domain
MGRRQTSSPTKAPVRPPQLPPNSKFKLLDVLRPGGAYISHLPGTQPLSRFPLAGLRERHHREALISVLSPLSTDTGLEITDLQSDPTFASRSVRERDVTIIPEGMRRIAHALVEHPETILQVLVETALELCGADSSAISLERDEPTEEAYYRWVAVAGQYSGMYDALFPHYPSGCCVCLERGSPQHVRAYARYFEILGVSGAPPVTDGLMFPWQTDENRGTMYILAHDRKEAFDQGDLRILEILADFAAIGVRQLRQQKLLMERTALVAECAMAHNLAHKINNPLQSLTNILYLAAEGNHYDCVQAVGSQALADLQRLSALVHELLSLPRQKIG